MSRLLMCLSAQWRLTAHALNPALHLLAEVANRPTHKTPKPLAKRRHKTVKRWPSTFWLLHGPCSLTAACGTLPCTRLTRRSNEQDVLTAHGSKQQQTNLQQINRGRKGAD